MDRSLTPAIQPMQQSPLAACDQGDSSRITWARDSCVARLWHAERRRGPIQTRRRPLTCMFRWALQVSNLGPPPCKSEEGEPPTSGNPEKHKSNGESD